MAAHSGLTASSDIHVCKGATTATVGTTVIADGAGGQSFGYGNAHGGCYFSNIGAPATVTAPSAYTKVAPTTVANGAAVEWTEGTNARLTYTGTATLDALLTISVSASQASGANRDLNFSIYKNGSAITGTETVVTTVTAVKEHVSMSFFIPNLATNDYIELYVKNAGGAENVSIYSLNINAVSVRG